MESRKFICEKTYPYNRWVTIKRQNDNNALFSVLPNILMECLKQKDSMIFTTFYRLDPHFFLNFNVGLIFVIA